MGSDHALEQDNRMMKVTGGIVGLTQKPSALNRFFLRAPIVNSLSEQFQSIYSNDAAAQKMQHYQLTGSHLARLIGNTKKILEVMDTFALNFTENDAVYNVISKAVLPDTVSNEILQHEAIGADLHKEFIQKRLHGDTSIWAPFKKRNFKNFKTELNKTFKSTSQEKIVQLKEETSLISRFLITSRKRSEIDLEFCLGNFEFSVVPKALFTADGEPLPCMDKAKLLHQIEESVKKNNETNIPDNIQLHQQHKVLILDGMAVINQFNKNAKVKTCKVSNETLRHEKLNL